MKTLLFVLGCMIGCAEDKDLPGYSDEEETINHPDNNEPEPEADPVGVIPGIDCQHIDIGDKACNFRLTDQDGKTWDLYDHTGEVILLDFSTVWCYPCQMAGHAVQGIQTDYEDEGFQFVTVLIDGYTAGNAPHGGEIDQWVEDHNITTAPVLEGSRDKMLDNTGIAGYMLGGFPTYIYIGRDMKFYSAHVGFSEEYIREKIEEGL